MDLSLMSSYLQFLKVLASCTNLPDGFPEYVWTSISQTQMQNKFSKPMMWIGIYIAIASLFCFLPMLADLLHGFKTKKLWFPCKYFTLNAVWLTVIAVAMKLPVDLNNSMPNDVDQAAKLGSLAFMCTMMANLLPCLASMNNKELFTNISALCVLVISVVVNVCIQIKTGVISYKEEARLLKTVATMYDLESLGINKYRNTIVAIVYVAALLALLIIYVCSSLAILKSKEIIEPKYQIGHKTASEDFEKSKGKDLTVGKLEEHVRNYWIMAGSGSPQFIIVCCATTTASGVICSLTTILHTLTMSWSVSSMLKESYDSDYKWSMVAILIVQFIGVILGTIAPLSRCFATVSFKMSYESILNHMKVFKVESYWTKRLHDWKRIIIRFPCTSNRLINVIINLLKNQILKFCIDIQEYVVVVCKIIAVIPICVLYWLRRLKQLLQAMFCSRSPVTTNSIPLAATGVAAKGLVPCSGNLKESPYILQLEMETELADRTLNGLSKSLTHLIKKSEKKHPHNLMNLITNKSTKDFKGVNKFDTDCWSLPMVTLTTIAVTLPNIEKEEVKRLFKSVREGLKYVKIIEENLIATTTDTQKAAKMLWGEVDVCHKWLGIKLKDIKSHVKVDDCKEDATKKIVESFKNEAKKKRKEGAGSTDDDSKSTSICANSMRRITEAIIHDEESHKNLFEELSSRIADIMAACLTNLPQVIGMKCHTSEIEKREASVLAAAKLLGETTKIINTLQDPVQDKWHAYFNMNPDDLPYIDKWCAYLRHP